jgi:hypothetical protein
MGSPGLERMLGSSPRMRGREWNLDLPDERLARFASENGIPFLPLAPALRRSTASGRPPYWSSDVHWNAVGHDLAAEQIARFVRESY